VEPPCPLWVILRPDSDHESGPAAMVVSAIPQADMCSANTDVY
jgi:hypothetical protein